MRGVANTELTPELVVALGRAAAEVLGRGEFVVGRDPRQSGGLLQAALSAGLASEGAKVVDVGVLPTPAVAAVSSNRNVPAAMISASHNPFADNGIKFFAAGGQKLSDAVQEAIEVQVDRFLGYSSDYSEVSPVRHGTTVGEITLDESAHQSYADFVIGALEGRRLDGVRIVIDCANGAASQVAPEVLRALGADLVVLSAEPNGTNINDHCGSTHPELLQAKVVACRAQLGLAFDGDADRMLAVDHEGVLVDGDQIMAMCALDLRDRKRLRDDTVVVTVMSNLGFKLAMADHGINLVETKVGDRYVLEAIEVGGYSLGGEQSGHLIFRDLATTGDGLLSGVLLADLVRRANRTLRDLSRVMTRLPQVLKNVRDVDRSRLDSAVALWAEVEAVEAELGRTGRVLLRPSGTEALVRVMVEAPTHDIAQQAADRLCAVVSATLR